MNAADFFVIAIVGLVAFRGYRRGFLVSLLRLASVFVSLIAAKMFHTGFADFIFKNFPSLKEQIYAGTRSFVIDALPAGGAGGIDFMEILKTANPAAASRISSGMSAEFLKNVDIEKYASTNPLFGSVVDTLTSQVATFVINVISFVVLFILVSMVVEILIFFVQRLRRLPVLGTFDGLLGLLLGGLQGAFITIVVLFMVSNMGKAGMVKDFYQLIENSAFAHKLLDIGFIQSFVKDILEITAKVF